MIHIAPMQDMAQSPEEIKESYPAPVSEKVSGPVYPYGLCISLTEKELEKLNLDDDVTVGDMIHIFGMAKVTSVSANASEDGNRRRVELQITHMSVENEDEENEEADVEEQIERQKAKRDRWYGNSPRNEDY